MEIRRTHSTGPQYKISYAAIFDVHSDDAAVQEDPRLTYGHSSRDQ